MVPLGALPSVQETNGPLVLTRYNMYPAAADQRQRRRRASAPATAIAVHGEARRAGAARPHGLRVDRAGLPGEAVAGHRRAGLRLSVVFVFLVLAALYESWALPLAVILVVPMCVACSLAAVWITDPSSAVHVGSWMRRRCAGGSSRRVG